MTDRDSECNYATTKHGARIHLTWEALGYAEDDFRPVHRQDRSGYYIRSTDTFIADEDMPWELVPQEPYYDIRNAIVSSIIRVAQLQDKFLGERKMCDG